MHLYQKNILLGFSLFLFTTQLNAQHENLVLANKFVQSLNYNIILWEPEINLKGNFISEIIPIEVVTPKNDTTYSFLKVLALNEEYGDPKGILYFIPQRERQNEQFEIRTANEQLKISFSKVRPIDISSTLKRNDVEMKIKDFKEKVRLRYSLRQEVQNYRESRYVMLLSSIGYGIMGYYGITHSGEEKGATFLGVLGTAGFTIGIGYEITEGFRFKRNKRTIREINKEFSSY